MEKDKVDEALKRAAEPLQRLEKSGDVDGFVIVAQKKMSQTTDGVAAIMTEYIDKRGWRFKVMHGLGEVWKARYNKPGKSSWKGVAVLPWREKSEDAEHDLEVYAEVHGMKKVEECDG